MISIASERNSVQIDTIEETKVNQQTSVNQEAEYIQAEALHIAEETTNENNEQNQIFYFNDYIYPEFAGYTGKQYLMSIIVKIAPLALERTWRIADGYRAPGKECYVSVERMLERVGPKARKIYLDLEAMEERGWLRQRRERMAFKNKEGITVYHAVTVKDFRGLYETAHDYHLWITSPEYLAPEQENLSLILADDALIKRLIKFENYRRVMVWNRAGRKRGERRDYYEEQLTLVEERRTDVQDVHLCENGPVNTSALYRKVITEENLTTNIGPNLSTARKETDVVPTTIRKTQNEEDTQTENREKHVYEHDPSPKPKTPPLPERKSAAAAKRVESVNGYTEDELKQDTQKRGAASAGIPAEHHRKLTGGKDNAEEQEQQQRESQAEPTPRPAREIPAQLVQEITQFAQQYDSAHLVASDVTRAAKIYFTAAQTLEYFQDTLFWAFFDEAMEAAKKLRGCEHTNTKGRVNRMPYFFTCLENAFVFSLEELVYLRSDEPLYTKIEVWDMIDHLRKTYQQQRQSGQTQLDYRSWLEQILNQQEHRKQPKSRKNVTAKDY
jgi:hypothetical protein